MGKICVSCGEEKDKKLFRSKRNKCLDCHSLYLKNYRQKNKEDLKRKREEKYQKNPEKQKIANKKSYENHRDDRLIRNKEYYEENRSELVEYQKEYRNNNKELIATYHRNKYHNDANYRLRVLIKSAIKRFFKSKNSKSITNYLAYSLQELKEHLEKQFEPWMTWGNQGKYNPLIWNDDDSSTWVWNIDHIVPQSDLPYTSIEDDNFKKCWALDNLRPLSAKQNLLDGSNRTRHV